MTARSTLGLRVQSIRYEAEDVRSFEFTSLDGAPLPSFAPGAHIDILLPENMERSYSLLNPRDGHARYRIAVQRSASSRGGSAYLVDQVRVGDVLQIVPPSNSFGLDEDAPLSILIGGGIGVTPLWSMIERLEQIGRPWRLHYACRTRTRAAFLAELAQLEDASPGRVFVVFDQEPGQSLLPVASIVAAAPAASHLYCCGPPGMLTAFEQATAGFGGERVHSEYFTSDQKPAAGGFEVVLDRSGEKFWVPENRTILETLLARGHQVPHSCMSGVCGTCETPVLSGIPDHRDHVLSAREKASNRKMMICCSGSLEGRLVLDL
jgi:vanillate O-demethylase ferredoxin subunit